MKVLTLSCLIMLSSCGTVPRRFTENDKEKKTPCNSTNNIISRDDSNYNLYYHYLHFPQRRVGNASVMDMSTYKIGEFVLYTTFDSVVRKLGSPICMTEHTGYHGEKVADLYYDRLRFTMVSLSEGSEQKVSTVYTYREDILSPMGLHCGMTLADVKTLIPYIELTCEAQCETNGILTIQRKYDCPELLLIFLDGEIVTMILNSCTG